MWIAIANGIGTRQGVGGGVGPTPPPPYTPPLDDFTGAIAAFSVRKLSSSYSGSCIEAYRVSDGATQDIGFDPAGLIDTAAIATFASGSDVRVSVWYDQSGNGVDITNTPATRYPLIYESGSITESNDSPALKCFNSEGLINTSGSFSFPISYFAVYTSNGSASGYSSNLIGLDRPVSGAYTLINTSSGITVQTTHDGYKAASYSGSIATGAMGLYRAIVNGAASNVGVQGQGVTNTLAASGSGGAIGVNFVEYSGGNANAADNHVTEVILFSDAKGTSDIEGIEGNLNSYYQVANLPAETGFLADYPNSAAAYSVRSLSNNAIKCMRVRRFVPPYDEKDIGFTPAGDLDEAAIVAFGGSHVLVVSAWYDQSGNSNHAEQIAPNSQPQIYDGSAVITKGTNNNPALHFDNNFLDLTSAIFTGDATFDWFAVEELVDVGSALSTMGIAASVYAQDRRVITHLCNESSSVAAVRLFGGNTTYSNTNNGYRLSNINYQGGGGAINAKINGSSLTITGSSNTGLNFQSAQTHSLGRSPKQNGGFVPVECFLTEVVLYDTDQSSNRTAIEDNINAEYLIYT